MRDAAARLDNQVQCCTYFSGCTQLTCAWAYANVQEKYLASLSIVARIGMAKQNRMYVVTWYTLQELCCPLFGTISFLAFLILLSAKAFGETTRDVKNTESQARYTRTMNFCPDYFPVLPIFQDNMQGTHVRSCEHLDCEGP